MIHHVRIQAFFNADVIDFSLITALYSMFRVSQSNNRENSILIQGAYATDKTKDIAGVVLQNFDNDTRTSYNMAKIAVRDAFGDTACNGMGDLIFKTNPDGGVELLERFRVTYDGRVGVGLSNPSYLFDVAGDANAVRFLETGIPIRNIYAPMSACNLAAEALTAANAASNLAIASSNISYSANLVAFAASNRAYNSLPLSGGILSGPLYIFQDTPVGFTNVAEYATADNSNATVFVNAPLSEKMQLDMNVIQDGFFAVSVRYTARASDANRSARIQLLLDNSTIVHDNTIFIVTESSDVVYYDQRRIPLSSGTHNLKLLARGINGSVIVSDSQISFWRLPDS
jgi:hypothetical protein